MSRSRREERCRAWHLLHGGGPIALAPAHARDLVTAQGQSTPRYRRKPPLLGASGLVVNAIVFDGHPLWFTVPDGNRSYGLRLEHDRADCITDQRGDAAPRPRGGLAQRVKLFLAEVNLGLFHICHFNPATDIRQVHRRGADRTIASLLIVFRGRAS